MHGPTCDRGSREQVPMGIVAVLGRLFHDTIWPQPDNAPAQPYATGHVSPYGTGHVSKSL